MSPAEPTAAETRDALAAEGARMMTICNACRYCEGYCAVFPAMERRLEFDWADMTYLANLCHGCGECFFACQFAPPHDFNVNVPQNLAQIRQASYRKYAWPQPVAAAFNRNAVGTAIVLAGEHRRRHAARRRADGPGRVRDRRARRQFLQGGAAPVMAGAFGAVSLFLVLALVIGCVRAWRDMGESGAEVGGRSPGRRRSRRPSASNISRARTTGTATAAARPTCAARRPAATPITSPSMASCCASPPPSPARSITTASAGTRPTAMTSLPVVLGTLGGVGLLIGPPLLYYERRKADQVLFDKAQDGLANALIVLLFLSSLTGLLLLALRSTPAMATLLIVHLAVVMTLFLTVPVRQVRARLLSPAGAGQIRAGGPPSGDHHRRGDGVTASSLERSESEDTFGEMTWIAALDPGTVRANVQAGGNGCPRKSR